MACAVVQSGFKAFQLNKPVQEEDIIPKNMRYPRLSPAWLKHEKQVLRWYGFFQARFFFATVFWAFHAASNGGSSIP